MGEFVSMKEQEIDEWISMGYYEARRVASIFSERIK
jgi:hypothetical protein